MVPKKAKEGPAGLEAARAEDLETLKQELCTEKEKAEAYLASWQRTQADFINYKRRTEQQGREVGQVVCSNLVLNLLPVLDDLERALGSIPEELDGQNWLDGVKLVERKLRTTLEGRGLSEIEALGKAFDPNLHEAMMCCAGEDGVVVREIQKGYKFHDKVIRPAVVAVGDGGEAEAKEE
ncbi:MAG: nucleotide exchange factor GrpE [Chloroflexota bacterium]